VGHASSVGLLAATGLLAAWACWQHGLASSIGLASSVGHHMLTTSECAEDTAGQYSSVLPPLINIAGLSRSIVLGGGGGAELKPQQHEEVFLFL